MSSEYLHAKARQRVSNYIVSAWDVLGRYKKIVFSGKKEEATEEAHYVGAVGGAREQAVDNGLVVAEEADT